MNDNDIFKAGKQLRKESGMYEAPLEEPMDWSKRIRRASFKLHPLDTEKSVVSVDTAEYICEGLQSRIADLEKANTDMKLSILNLLVKVGALESRLQSANDYLKSHNMGEF